MEGERIERPIGKKIGVIGGTFNPIHVGHLMLAEWALEAAELDLMLFLPAGHPYMKNNEAVPEGAIRLHMVELAVENNTLFKPSSMEVVREGDTYTCDTMEQLKREHPEDTFYFVIGADCLYTIEKWKDPERIFRSCHVIAAARSGSPIEEMEEKRKDLAERFHANISLLQFPDIEISSTDIRNRVRAGKSIRYLVPEKVREYIIANHLYQDR